MPRVTVLGLALALIATLVAPAAARVAGAPLTQELPTAEPLMRMTLETMPAAPVRIQLFRMTLAPGATVPLHTRPGPEMNRIETGTFATVVQGTPIVERASTGATPEPAASPES